MGSALAVMIKPVSGQCNLKCRYCFYMDEMEHRETAFYGKMSMETARNIIAKSMNRAKYITFIFQGGEPTLAGLDFYRGFVEEVRRYQHPEQMVRYSLQTNGTMINAEWARFFKENDFLIGVSLDGPRKIHDQCRDGSWNRVMLSVRLLKEYKVEFNVLTVVTAYNASRIGQIYRFFKEEGLLYQQYIPCIDPLDEERPYSLKSEDYGSFLKELYGLWYQDGTYIRMFDNLVGMMRGYPPESCDMGGVCSVQYVFEADGSVYPCDFYVLDEWRLGNINEDSYDALDRKREELGFIQASCEHPQECQQCEWHWLCRNGCRRNRIQGKNRFCQGMKEFLEYACHQEGERRTPSRGE